MTDCQVTIKNLGTLTNWVQYQETVLVVVRNRQWARSVSGKFDYAFCFPGSIPDASHPIWIAIYSEIGEWLVYLGSGLHQDWILWNILNLHIGIVTYLLHISLSVKKDLGHISFTRKIIKLFSLGRKNKLQAC